MVIEITEAFGISVLSWQKVRSIYRVTTNDGKTFAVKPFRQGISTLLLAVELHQAAASSTPGLLPLLRHTVRGEAFFRFRGNRYLCFEWVEGVWLDYLKLSDRRRSFWTVARWRELARGVNVPRAMGDWGKGQIVWEERLEEMKKCRQMAKASGSIFSKLFLKYWDFYYTQAARGLDALVKSAYMQLAGEAQAQSRVCHGDWAHHNLLMRPGGEVVLLDLEYLRGDLPLLDLVDLLRRFLTLDGNDLRFIQVFFKWTQELALLCSRDEAEVLTILWGFPETFWMIGRQYFIERLAYSEEYWLQRFSRKVPAPGLWDRWSAEIFRAVHGKDDGR